MLQTLSTRAKYFTAFGLALVWMVCVFLLCEAAFRAYGEVRYTIAHRRSYWENVHYREQDDVLYQQVRAASPPPDSVPWQSPPRTAFLTSDESGRMELARQRQEMILICDEQGVVKKTYPVSSLPDFAWLGEHIQPGNTLHDLLADAEADDALYAITTMSGNEHAVRDYYVPVGGGRTRYMEFNALLYSQTPRLFALFLGDSRLESPGRYRPHIYRRNWYTAQYINSDFWTNGIGFRSREIALPKPDGTVRIACIGGSTTVEGPHNGLTYPAMLESFLREATGTDKIEVINCGVDGLGFPLEFARMTDYLALAPDVILHYNVINDIAPLIDRAMESSGMLLGLKGQLRRMAVRSRFLTTLFPRPFLPDADSVAAELEEGAIAFLQKMNDAANDAGVSLVIASFATPNDARISKDERLYFDRSFHYVPLARATTAYYNKIIGIYNEKIRVFCQENGLLYVPVAENFSGGLDTFTDICHMRLRGIELKARIMAEHMEDFVRERLAENHFAGEET